MVGMDERCLRQPEVSTGSQRTSGFLKDSTPGHWGQPLEEHLIISMPSNKSWGNISHDSGNQKAITWVKNCVWKARAIDTVRNSFMGAHLSETMEIPKSSSTQQRNFPHAEVQAAFPIHFSYEFLNLGCSNFKSLCRLAALPLLYVVNISPSCEIQEQISLCILQSLKTIDFNCCPMETQV